MTVSFDSDINSYKGCLAQKGSLQNVNFIYFIHDNFLTLSSTSSVICTSKA